METNNNLVLKALSDLFRIVEAGEKGYATAAINAHNRGIKLLFKSYAQQRAEYKAEILKEIRRLGGDFTPGSSLPGMIHRGRVAIFAAMTIEDDKRERVVLKEVALGESYAAQTYKKTLAVDLPPETRAMVERQFEEVRQVIEQVQLLLGNDEKHMVVHLFKTEPDAEQAVHSLESAGFRPGSVEKIALDQSVDVYTEKGTTVLDTILSGMFGGVVWGSIIGVLAALGAGQVTVPAWLGFDSVLIFRLLIALGVIAAAALVGGLIGLVIGNGIAEHDTYEYQQSTLPGRYLVKAVVDPSRAKEASQLLDQSYNRLTQPPVSVST
jgi:uncharacterized protein (TIGR02284 family)